MKGLVVYDSVYGNTKKVAEAIAEEIRAEGNEVAIRSAKDRFPEKMDVDFVLVGSPTRMGRMTGASRRFVKALGKSLGNRPVGFFDTVMPGVIDKKGSTAAQRLHDLAKEKGLDAHAPVLHVTVTGMRGPLQLDAAELAKVFTREFLANTRH